MKTMNDGINHGKAKCDDDHDDDDDLVPTDDAMIDPLQSSNDPSADDSVVVAAATTTATTTGGGNRNDESDFSSIRTIVCRFVPLDERWWIRRCSNKERATTFATRVANTFTSTNTETEADTDTTTAAASVTAATASTSFLLAIITTMYWYEMKLQRQLTAPPIVYGQINNINSNDTTTTVTTSRDTNNNNSNNNNKKNQNLYEPHLLLNPFSNITISDIYQHMTQPPPLLTQSTAAHHQNHNNNNIIERAIQPSLFVGTRAYVSSTMAYLIQNHQFHVSSMLPTSILRGIRSSLFSSAPPKQQTTLMMKKKKKERRTINHNYNYHYDKIKKTIQFREVMKMPSDGATIAIDWKFPFDANSNDPTHSNNNNNNNKSIEEYIHEILYGPIARPVVLILHGINNHTNFGYIQSMMNAVCDNHWIAAGMNFRGCATSTSSQTTTTTTTAIHDDNAQQPASASGEKYFDSTTPRTYNGAYTGDLRTVVQKLSIRLAIQQQQSSNSKSNGESHQDHQRAAAYHPLFLVGNSLGANLVAKYLGEEGRSSTVHPCIAGGVTMGNPMHIDSRNASPFISPLIALGAKRGLYNIYPTMTAMIRSSLYFRQCMTNGWKAITLANYDNAMAPIFCRNYPTYPFQYQIGYHNTNSNGDTAEEYWVDASSYRQVPYISVPFLQLIARDDFLTYRSFRNHMYYNTINPYVMVMETTCGGHLGWHEAVVVGTNSANNNNNDDDRSRSWADCLLGSSWADVAMVDFIQAILDLHEKRQLGRHSDSNDNNSVKEYDESLSVNDNDGAAIAGTPRSRL